ncbi:MAG: polysaccharide biosynthesis tyrosine autokinase [Terracidiphilus sp.]
MSNHQPANARVEAPAVPLPATGQQFQTSDALHGLIRVISKRRKWIIAAIVVCESLALAITLLMKPTYESTATIELNKQGSGMDLGLGEELSSTLGGGNEALLTDLQTETAILEGDSLALAVIEQLNLATKPPFALTGSVSKEEKAEAGFPLEQAPVTRTRLLKVFSRHLRVVPERGTRLIQVSFSSHDLNLAAEVANQLVEAYKSNYRQTHYDAITETSGWLTTQLTDLKTNVEQAEKKLTDFEKANGILSFNMAAPASTFGNEPLSSGVGNGNPEIHSPIIQKLDELNHELTQAEADRIGKEAIYHLTQSGDADVVLGLQSNALAEQSMVLTEGGGLSNLQNLRSQLGLLKVQLAQESNAFGPNNRHLKDLEVQIGSVNDQITQELQLITKRARADFQLAKQTEDEIRRRFDQQQAAASKLNDVAIQFAVLSDEAMSHKLLYEDLYTKLQEANISAGIKATNITVVSPARTESEPIRPKPVMYLALGVLIGIFAGLAAAYTVDSLDRTVSTPEEVEEITGRPVIGIIPDLMKSGKSYGAYLRRPLSKSAEEEAPGTLQVWMLAHPDSVAAEAFRSLRTSIMLSRAGGGAKTLLITSCVPGEGKTTVTSNLAAAFAQHNKKVLIVEADMRRPRMTHVMDVSSEVGLSNVLTATASIEDAIVRGIQLPTLDILPAGPQPPNPSELLGSSAFAELLQRLRAQYDLVLLDSPPALLVADPISIASLVDAVVWISRAGVVTRPYLNRANGMIDRHQMPVIGFVVNGVSSGEAGYGYGSYYTDKEKGEKKNAHGA